MNTVTPYVTVKQLASLLNVSPATIYYWVSRLEIPFLKVGKHLRFDVQAVIDTFDSRTSAGACLNVSSLVTSQHRACSLKSEGGPTGSIPKGSSNGNY